MSDKPYRVAELAYRPWDEYPWYVVRTGAVADQGGYRFGTEGIGFKTIDDALMYVKSSTIRDLEAIVETFQKQNFWSNCEDSQEDWP